MEFTEQERAILHIVQHNLPASLTPYADIAAEVGCEEKDVLALLASLKESGAIRRFGASIKHQKSGYTHNCMVAWEVAEEDADKAGKAAAQHSRVSHCYFRPTSAPDWPYTLYTMVHGKSEEDAGAVIQELAATELGRLAQSYARLESIQELKKTSMKYF